MQDFVSLLSRYRTYIMGVAMICIMLFHQGWITQPLGLFQLYGCHGVDIFSLFLVSEFISHYKNILYVIFIKEE